MKIAIPVDGTKLDDILDSRFGRASRFIVFNTDDDTFIVLDNTQNLEAAQGAGIQSARNVAESGATVLLAGHTGPKAFSVLTMASIEVYHAPSGTVRQALEAYRAGSLARMEGADVDSHWV